MSNFGYIFKGIMLTLAGLLLAFFPGIISMIFYIIGGIVIISCIFSIIGSSGDGTIAGAGIAGIILGIGIMFIPRLISVGIPIIAGILFCCFGISRIIKSFNSQKSKDSRTANLIFGIILLAIGVFLFFNPFKASMIARIAIGVALLLYAAFNFYVAYAIAQRNKNSSSKIIDVDSFSVSDDNKFLK